ncbi:MAG: 50S ribosomal protein L2 [Parcubacteria group bacterium]|nr:50S ribosomal protein L2 [Parcubacteria group bacterium]
MSIKIYKPTTPSRRYMKTADYSTLTKKKPEKSLTLKATKTNGRSRASGRITSRHRGGGNSRKYRLVDFKRRKYDMKAEVIALEYDPNRTAFIALIKYEDGEKSYIIAPETIKVGDSVISSEKKIDPNTGNRMPLKHIPTSTYIYEIELNPGRGSQIAKSAGSQVQLMSLEGKYAQVKLASGEVRNILSTCMATVGQVSNAEHSNIQIGKAGRSRWKGIRPHVRGKAMNAVDHPHGGGEGSCPIGMKHPKTPWGKIAIGTRTRKKNKKSNKLIIKRRK